jgi:CHAT domain-containing protein
MFLGVCVLLGIGSAVMASAASTVRPDVHADSRMEEGMSLLRRGAFERAVVSFTEAAELYEQADKQLEQSEAYLRLAEAHQALGQYRRALRSLESARRLAAQLNDRLRLARIAGSLGDLHLAAGQDNEAERYLNESLRLSRELGNTRLSAVILTNLGNLFASQRKYSEALAAYAESLELARAAQNRPVLARAMVNAATVTMQAERYLEAKDRFDRALEQVQTLDPSHDKAYGFITIGQGYHKLYHRLPTIQDELSRRAFQVFSEAAATAEMIRDVRAGSYAAGYLGALYEGDHRYQDALELTNQAISLAQQVVAPESLYRWHWQAGRLLKAMDRPEEAIAAYRRAVAALQSIRPELTATYGKDAASFRESLGAVYFELADLLLRQAASAPEGELAEAFLKEARDTVELFKVAELRDYFHDDCVEAARSRVTTLEGVSKAAAVVYPILLPDRLELLVSLPGGMTRVSVQVQGDRLTQEVRAFRKYLEKRTTREYLPHAQQLYDWLIRPIEPALAAASIETLVFVPDGPLRTIPMAALHDGKQFLIRKYAVATTPGLTLTDPRPLEREAIRVLSVGLTESVQGFSPLPNVSEELATIKALYGGTVLLNQDFVVSRVEKELKRQPFSVVHVASHGQFDQDSHKTFLLAYDDKLTMDRLDQFVGLLRFRDDPLALLTLSACETAAGDDRAALGLAGVAIKAGARSALATLWFINDQASTALVTEFYRQLHDAPVSKAVALQRAQLKILKDPVYDHPAYWSPFLLLNNWL